MNQKPSAPQPGNQPEEAPPSVEENTGPRRTWIHVHVPKAGGSTLRQLFNRNFAEGFYNSNSLLETRQYTAAEISEIVRCHPWLRCFSDHKVSMDLPYEHADAQVMAIGFVRDPVERFISRYFFHRNFEEVACIAQRMSFREFATEELINGNAHPQTNSQIYFLNGGRSFDDMTLIESAINTGQAYLFPIERFDEACICLEKLFPESFPDLSYVRTNVSKKDTSIDPDDQLFVADYLTKDQPVWDLANQFLNSVLDKAFPNVDERVARLEAFRELCSRRYHNFKPPRPVGWVEPESTDSEDNDTGSSTIRNRQSNRKRVSDELVGEKQTSPRNGESDRGATANVPQVGINDGESAAESSTPPPTSTQGN